jgi:hypothetical protein
MAHVPPTRAPVTQTRSKITPTGARVPPTRSEVPPTRAETAPTWADTVPTRSETGAKLTSARPESAPPGLPAEAALRPHEASVGRVPEPGIDGIDQSAAQAAHDGAAVAQDGVGSVHGGGNGVAHQRGAVVGDGRNQARPVPAVGLVTPIGLVTAVRRCVAVLVGQHLLQATDGVASEIHSGQRVGRRERKLLGRRIDPGEAHRLVGTVEERLGRFGAGKQRQDVSDQRVHGRFPSNPLKPLAGLPAFRYTRYAFGVGAESGSDPPEAQRPSGVNGAVPLGD